MITVGVIGGGQLARMLALAAIPLDIRLVVLESDPACPAAAVADVIVGAYDDEAAVRELARRSDVVTVELEGVPIPTLQALESHGLPVRPGWRAVRVAQDRLVEKRTLSDLDIAVAAFEDGIGGVPAPALVKTRRGGYDGRGQVLVASESEWRAAVDEFGDRPVITERLLRFERELSILAVRTPAGETAFWPLVENEHRNGILHRTTAPATGPAVARLQSEAEDLARRLGERLGYEGVFCVELFESGGHLIANELAPRVHNSGHWTIEGADTSQFEQHLRAICGLPLGSTGVRGASVMINIVGVVPDVPALLAVEGAHVHLYGKTPRPARKIGHVTVTGPDARSVQERATAVETILLSSAAGGTA